MGRKSSRRGGAYSGGPPAFELKGTRGPEVGGASARAKAEGTTITGRAALRRHGAHGVQDP